MIKTNLQPVVQVENVTKVYGKKGEKPYEALKGIDFTVEPGEFVGIMGASGSGKTTLLNMLATLDKPTTGKIKIEGQDVTQLSGNALADFRGQKIGFIFQDFNLLDNLTAFDNIALPLSLQNVSAKKIKTAVEKVADILGITQILGNYPTELSGGQKQRVASARALVHQPAILFADEPTGALDSKSATDLLEMMSRLNQDQNESILMVTHDTLSASYTNRILFIQDGLIGQELKRGDQSQSEFYHTILQTLGGK